MDVTPENILLHATGTMPDEHVTSPTHSKWTRITSAAEFQIDRGAVEIARPALGVAFTRRAVWVGSALVAFVAAFTPYNDLVLKNTFFIGNHLPIGIFTLLAGLVLIINPLLTLLKQKAFSTGELIVMLSMMLVGACAPSSGLMRYFESMLISPFFFLKDYPWLHSIVALIPHALVPTTDPASQLVKDFELGIPPRADIPLVAFIIPGLLWGILFASLFGATVFLAAIFRKQWMQYERLSYPLATLSLELLAAPEPGRCYNRLWRNPILWAGMAIPILLYMLSGLHQYFPSVPYVSLYYHFHDAFTEHPWDHLPTYIPDNRLIFSAVGLTFFMPSEVAFSMWFFLLLDGLCNVAAAKANVDVLTMMPVRSIGVSAAYFISLLFLARRHLFHVVASAFRSAGVEDGEFASYRTMFFGFIACAGIAWAWMMAVGISPLIALLVLGLGLMLFTLMARIVAETGLFFIGTMWSPPEFISSLLGAKLVSAGSYYWSNILSRLFFMDLRETLMPYAANTLRMASDLEPRHRRPYFKWIFTALALSIIISGLSQHYLSYIGGRANMDDFSSGVMPVSAMTDTFAFNHRPAPDLGGAWWNFSLGGLMVAGLMIGRMLFVSWPFHPIGLLLMHVWPMQVFWFSIMIGWIIKQALLHYGGAFAFRRAKPFFLGLILGEMLTAGIWLFLGLLTGGTVTFKMLPG